MQPTSSPNITAYKSLSEIDSGLYYVPYLPLTYASTLVALEIDDYLNKLMQKNIGDIMYRELVADHASECEQGVHTCIFSGEKFEDLMDWCIVHCSGHSWTWTAVPNNKIKFTFARLEDCVQAQLTWGA